MILFINQFQEKKCRLHTSFSNNFVNKMQMYLLYDTSMFDIFRQI